MPTVFVVVAGVLSGLVIRTLTTNCLLAGGLAIGGVVLVAVGVGPIAGPLVPFMSAGWILGTASGVVLGIAPQGKERARIRSRSVRHRFAAAAAVVGGLAVVAAGFEPANAWIASARLKRPTVTMNRTHGVDLVVDTHQWLANRGVEILRNDSKTSIVDFLDSPDPSAPIATTGTPGTHESYRWRLLMGASDADGSLYPQIPDHFHNWWTHAGRQWIGGSSAASNAEIAFSNAKVAWNQGDKAKAMHWLGATVHLTTDICVPQHQFFMVNVYHHQFEVWVRRNQSALAVDSGGIYRADFRERTAHGGTDWSSAHPRGWVDECAHRSAAMLQASTHSNATVSKASDPQWLTAPLISDAQRISAGLIAFFFDEVHGP